MGYPIFVVDFLPAQSIERKCLIEKVASGPVPDLLSFIYGEPQSALIAARLQDLIDHHQPPKTASRPKPLSEQDALLITYADQVQQDGVPPLQTLADFCRRWLAGVVSGIHLLPFYPYSSDDGFSVIDYRRVAPDLGGWDDIARMGDRFRLMFDAVINHISVQSDWFQGFLKDDPRYRDYFIEIKGDPDLSAVVRPRALPLLTPFQTPSGTKQVWTTFSADQVDLNYANPEVLLEIIEVILFYAQQGAEFIRLDAIAYLWKEIGTPCIHLPQTHAIIKLLRAVLDLAAQHVLLITETNVPHQENISYFGNGRDEAQLVYNFALPPLVLYTFHTADALILSEWARRLKLPGRQVTFFNFLASHDGIGVNPARGILPPGGVELLVEKTLQHGGGISYKHLPDGSQSPYELNINYFDALCNPHEDLPLRVQVDRFIAAQAIMLALIGVPGIYFHSLFGSLGWSEGVRATGRARTINRQKLSEADLTRDLTTPGSLREQVYRKFRQLLQARRSCPAFDPFGDQRVLDCGSSVFALERIHPQLNRRAVCLQNISSQPQTVPVAQLKLSSENYPASRLRDLLSGQTLTLQTNESLTLGPYQVLWLENTPADG